ncbi:MAG: helix-turn-helix transcriptional regulator [Anaerovoracaceae bacterium]
MHLSYEKLWHILLDKHMTREALRKQCGISSNTIAKLGKGQNVTTDVLLKICEALKCHLNDIVETIDE